MTTLTARPASATTANAIENTRARASNSGVGVPTPER
jgi:hypothetical protein